MLLNEFLKEHKKVKNCKPPSPSNKKEWRFSRPSSKSRPRKFKK